MRSRAFLVVVILLWIARAWLVLSCADVFGYGEEFHKGAVAKLLVSDLPIERWRLPYVPHEGGGFVVAHLKALVFAAIGPSVLAQKVAAMLTTTALLAAGWSFARAHFGERAAAIFGLCFVLAPDAQLRFSLLGLGTHFEACIFVLLVLDAALRLAREGASRARDWLVLGLASGFGLYFSLIVAPALVVAGLVVLRMRARELVGRGGALLVLGALAGASPLLWMASHVGLDAVRVRGNELVGEGSSPFAAARELAKALASGDVARWIAIAAYVAAFAAAARLALDPAARRARRVLLGLGAVFLAAYLSSSLALRGDVSWMFFLRLSPLWIALTLLVAHDLERLDAAGGGRRTLARVAIAAIAAVGLHDLVALVRGGRWDAPRENLALLARTNGCDYAGYFDKLQTHLDVPLGEEVELLARVDEDKELLLPEIGLSLFEHAGLSLPDALELLHAKLGPDAPLAIAGLRFFVHPGFGHDLPAAVRALDGVRDADRPALAEAIGRAGFGPRYRADRLEKLVDLELDERDRPAYLRGVGWRVYRTFPLRPDLARAFLDELGARDPGARDGVAAGFEHAARVHQNARR